MTDPSTFENSNLSFKVFRLSKPKLNLDLPFKLDLTQDIAIDNTIDDLNATVKNDDESFYKEFSERTQSNNASEMSGLLGAIELPKSNDLVYLGETFSCLICFGNRTSKLFSDVSCRIEIRTHRETIMLTDLSSSEIDVFSPGDTRNFIVKHDIKELGAHSLVCLSLYTNANGEKVTTPQYFSFKVLSPLALTTKLRSLNQNIYLEACLENLKENEPLIIDYLTFDPKEEYEVEEIKADQMSLFKNGPLEQYAKYMKTTVNAKKGTRSFLFKFTYKDKEKILGQFPKALGRMEIKWFNCFGESGRLQTQQIQYLRTNKSDNDTKTFQIASQINTLPENELIIYQPFEITIYYKNISKSALSSMWILKEDDDYDKYKIYGHQSIHLEPLLPNILKNITITLVPIDVGVIDLTGLVFMSENKTVKFGLVESIQIFVRQN